MKAFLIKLSVYTVLLIAGAFALDFALTEGLKKSGVDEFSTWNDIFFLPK